MNDLSITLKYSELLMLYSSLVTISSVYGENAVRDSLVFSLEHLIDIASNTHVVEINVEA